MRIGAELGLPQSDLAELYYALLLKDAGCSSNSSRLFHIIISDEIRAKRDVKTTDWTRVGWDSLQYAITHVATGAPFLERIRQLAKVAVNQQADSCDLVKIRCERGASIARRIGFSEQVAQAIFHLDEHFNGRGYPDGLSGEGIPLLSRIMLLAQTIEVFHVHGGCNAAIDVILARSGRWFDPSLVRIVQSLHQSGALWADLESESLQPVLNAEPPSASVWIDDSRLDEICLAFAEVVDAKSPFTYRHSNGVADAAVAMAVTLGMSQQDIRFVRRAALLHDIGKLSVSNSILEKPGKLDNVEWEAVRKHPFYTLEILRRIPGFTELSEVAAAHHERLDGKGYFRNWDSSKLNLPARILAVADVFDALAAKRPYRDALPLETVLSIMGKDIPNSLDPQCFEALKLATSTTGRPAQDLLHLSSNIKPSGSE